MRRRVVLQSSLIGLGSACVRGPASRAGIYDVRAMGARGDGSTDDTKAIQAALDACAARGGGTVVVPSGTYQLRPIQIGSRTTLQLDTGAVLKATTRLEDYPQESEHTSHESTRSGLIRARNAVDVAIVGRGVIDGSGMSFVITNNLSYPGKDHDPAATRQGAAFMQPPPGGFPHGPFARGQDRPGNPLHFRDCRHVLLEGITIQNSPVWNCHLERCTDVLISGIHITSRDSDFRVPNDDGIDLTECRRVRIVGCDIETGDDCIAVFGSQDVVVSTCTLQSRSTGVRVGYNGPDIKRCSFENLIIRNSHRGVSVFVRSEGSVEDVSFANISIETQHYTGRWWGKGEPIHVSALLWEPNKTKVGQIRDIRFRNISARGEAGMVVWGAPDSIIRDVVFDDVRLAIRKGPLQASYGGNFDLRATRDKAQGLFKHDISALHAEGVAGLRVRNMRLDWEDGLPDYFTDGLTVQRFDDVVVDGFDGRQAQDRGAAIRLRDGKNAVIRSARARRGTDALVRHDNVQGLVVEGLEARQARVAVEPKAG